MTTQRTRTAGRERKDHLRGQSRSNVLASNPEYYARTKHIDIQYHFVHKCVENGDIELEYCPTADMVADALTKALPKKRHWLLLEKMGMNATTLSSS